MGKRASIPISGVYRIINVTTKKSYIGSSVDIEYRKYSHLCSLRGNKHHSLYLQRAYNKYGEENLKFEILARCPKEYVRNLEAWFIEKSTINSAYNIVKVIDGKFVYEDSTLAGWSKSRQVNKLKTPQQHTRKSSKEIEEIVNRLNRGCSFKEITNELKVSSHTITRIKRLYGHLVDEKYRGIQSSYGENLNSYIKSRLSNGESYSRIARELGIAHSTVRNKAIKYKLKEKDYE